MNMIPNLRGMPDVFPEELEKHHAMIEIFQVITKLYGCRPIATPIVEPLETFSRTVGDTSDIVSKEMYTLIDRNGKDLCLRPENTAGIVRAILNANKTHIPNQKYAYFGPMFRYERPQKGRLRQFHQLGVEYIASETPYADAEIIALANHLTQQLGIQSYTLEINSLGDSETRSHYKKALVDYFTAVRGSLSEESQTRLAVNPLRILDSKDPQDQALNQTAPKLFEYLSKPADQFLKTVLQSIDKMGIPYVINPLLVRGLDYYSHTIFEFKSSDLGAQSTFLAGGRYDQLAKQLGHQPLPSIGWAAGIERLALLSSVQSNCHASCLIIPGIEAAIPVCLALAEKLRQEKIKIDCSLTPSIKAGLKKANKDNVSFCILVGETELASAAYLLKNMSSGDQTPLTFNALLEKLKSYETY